METTVSAMVVFSSQLLMIFLRFVNVRAIANHHIGTSVLLTGGIQISWLIASAYGIKALLEGDFVIVVAYILGGMAGSYLSFAVKIEDKR